MDGVGAVRLPIGRGGPAAEPAGGLGAAVVRFRGRGWQHLAGGEAVPARADLLQPERATGWDAVDVGRCLNTPEGAVGAVGVSAKEGAVGAVGVSAIGGIATIASSGAGEKVRIVGDGDVDPEADRVRIVGDA